MATNKKGFVLYCDLIHTMNKLTDDEAGKLIKLVLEYVNDLNPKVDDRFLEIVFEPIKQQLKRDLSSYDETIVKRVDSGILGNLKRWNKDLYDKVINKELSLHKANEIAKHRKTSHGDDFIARVAVTDTVTVTDKVTDTVSVNNTQQFFKDFPNSSELEQIAKDYKLQKEQLTGKINDFKKVCETSYPTYQKFVFHFKNWLNKNPYTPTKTSRELK